MSSSSVLNPTSHDPELDLKLAESYNNLRKGLRSTHRLWLQVRQKVPAPHTVHKYKFEPSLAYVKNWIQQQAAHSTHQSLPVDHYFPIQKNRSAPWQRMQMDIFFPGNPQDEAQYTKHTCVLLIIDTVTRYLLAYPMKSKDGPDVVAAFEEFLKDTDELNEFPPVEIDIDQESSFLGTLKNYCTQHGLGIQFVTNRFGPDKHSDDLKLAFINRACRTLRTLIDKYQVQYDTADWDQALPELVYGYNHTPNESTGESPVKMLEDSHNEGEAWRDGQSHDQHRVDKLTAKAEAAPWNQTDLHIGSLVRVPIPVKTNGGKFRKRSKQRWKTAPGKISAIKDGVYYTVKSENGAEHTYKKTELLPISASTHSNIAIKRKDPRVGYQLPNGGKRKLEQEAARKARRGKGLF